MTKNLFAIVFLLVSASMQAMEQGGKKSPSADQRAERAATQFLKEQAMHHKGGKKLSKLPDSWQHNQDDTRVEGKKNKPAQAINVSGKKQKKTALKNATGLDEEEFYF
ncbi:MAG: hypothetical protein EBU90_05305 [Proteobacteria bacterium]|nr:hypothetical protein [Pseudomonadota bacterium]